MKKVCILSLLCLVQAADTDAMSTGVNNDEEIKFTDLTKNYNLEGNSNPNCGHFDDDVKKWKEPDSSPVMSTGER